MIHLLALTVLGLTSQATICIDPGHPSEIGRGTKGRHISEIHANWLVGQELGALLKEKGYNVVFTKTSENQYVTNPKRAEIANKAKADLMIRLHCDHDANSRGIATYFADKKGTINGVSGPSDVVLKRVKPMAAAFHKSLIKNLNGMLRDRGLKTDRQTKVGAKYGALIGSIHSECPSILVEMCVLSNVEDEKVISSKAGREKLVIAICGAIKVAL
jgi:N-acetylmuramoyl-L-alanine amidase